MRKLIMFNLVSLDGFFEGPKREIDWHNVDDEFVAFSNDQLDSAGALLFGRVTYQLMAGFWPTPAGEIARGTADRMNTLPKVVFSQTLDKAEWTNTRLVKGDVGEEIRRLKGQPGKDLFLLGSADLASTLTRLGLIDEYRVMVNPVVLGSGHPLFKGPGERLAMKLVGTRTFKNGNVLLTYQPIKKAG